LKFLGDSKWCTPMPSKRGRKRARNPKQFTTDEAQTASLLVGEGFGACHTSVRRTDKIYRYPQLRTAMCDKEALEPASRVFASPIKKHKEKRLICPRHLYPPDGKGIYYVAKTGHPAQKIIDRLEPLLTKEFIRKWEETKKRCPLPPKFARKGP